jgi:hypothetical protein
MQPGRSKHVPFVLPLLLALVALGCGKELQQRMAPNQAPEVFLNPPTLTPTEEGEVAYAISWKAQDQNGRVDHYLYALDPASVDKVDAKWIRSGERSAMVRFPRRTASAKTASATALPGDEFHVFAVCAVDDQESPSTIATVALFEDNVAPIVLIENPHPNSFLTAFTTPNPTIRWQGEDADGHIVRFKYRLFQSHNPDFPQISDFIDFVMSNPNVLTQLYGPTFASWDSVAGQTSVQYSDLTPNQLYLFAITAVDNRGAFDPLFSSNRNVLKFAVTYPGTLGPAICATSPNFNFCQPTANTDAPPIQIPQGTAIPVSWVAQRYPGAEIAGYRWAIDPPLPLGDSPSTWGSWSLDRTSTTIGPLAGGSEHALYIQAKDSNDLISTMKIPFAVISDGLEKDLLIVDDTRLTPDVRGPTGGTEPPRGPWPTAAELDTFLYARGGVPWRDYPAGTLSASGILAGYDFDTLGTRGIADGIVPLSVLSRYRHVIWMTDDVGATYTGSPGDLLQPVTSLRLMSLPGFQNTLAAYAQQGGKVWLQGGGAAYATLVAWNRRNTPSNEFTNLDGELVEGRFMYDFAHWQSGIRIVPAQRALLNAPLATGDPTTAPGRGWPGQPPYEKLVTHVPILLPRTCATDPPSPLRDCGPFYLIGTYTAEFLFRPNAIVEDVDPRPNHETPMSALDTLYMALGGTTGGRFPVMTYYHGSQSAPLVFSGFPVWYFQRQQCQALTDFVLQDVWGLSKQPTVAQVSSRAARAGAIRPAATLSKSRR